MSAALGLLLEIFGLAAIAGLVTSLLLTWLGLKVARHPRLEGVVLPWAVTLGFIAGYALLPRDFAGFRPEPGQPWKWLPILAVLTAAITSALVAVPRSWAWKLALFVVIPVTTICLTPTWPVWGLEPQASRWLLVGYLFLVGVPLQPLPPQQRWRLLPPFLAATATFLALATGALVSTRFAQLAAITSFSLAGTGIVLRLVPTKSDSICQALIPLYCTLVGGIAWIACVDPDPPAVPPLLVPLLPASLWLLVAKGKWFENTRQPKPLISPPGSPQSR